MSGTVYQRTDCRVCGNKELDPVFSLLPSPIGDAYVLSEHRNLHQPTYLLDWCICHNCGLVQLVNVIDPSLLYDSYIYVTANSPGLDAHFLNYAREVSAKCQLNDGALVLDIGSNDGTLLKQFKLLGKSVVGVDPATNIAAAATACGINTVSGFFSPALAKNIVTEYGHPDLITANNVFANIDDLWSWVEGIEVLLGPKGIFTFESFYLADVLNNLVFDFLYHEHLSAFSAKPVKHLFARFGLELIAIQKIPTKGGSLRYFVQRAGGPLNDDGSVARTLLEEEVGGVYQKSTYDKFSFRVNSLKKPTLDLLSTAKRDGKVIAGFGASVTATTLIYHFELGPYLDFLVDDNPVKQGRYSPGLHLPVYSAESLVDKSPDIIIILAWRFAEQIMNSYKAYIDKGGVFLIPVPEFKLVSNA